MVWYLQLVVFNVNTNFVPVTSSSDENLPLRAFFTGPNIWKLLDRWGRDLNCMAGALSVQIPTHLLFRPSDWPLWGRTFSCNEMTSFRSFPRRLDLIADFRSLVTHHNSSDCWRFHNLEWHEPKSHLPYPKKCKHNLTGWWLTFEFLSHGWFRAFPMSFTLRFVIMHPRFICGDDCVKKIGAVQKLVKDATK
jgi:hypothetical protein